MFLEFQKSRRVVDEHISTYIVGCRHGRNFHMNRGVGENDEQERLKNQGVVAN